MVRLIRALPGIIDGLARYANFLALVSLVAMTLLINVEVFSRTIFGVSTLVGEEWPAYLLVCIVFFGMANTFRKDGFISVEIVSGRLRRKHQVMLKCLCIALAVIFVVLFDYQLITFVVSSYTSGLKSISYSETPLFIPQLAMPVGVTLIGLQLIKTGIESLRLLGNMGDARENGQQAR